MEIKTYYEVWFSVRGTNTMRDYQSAVSLSDAKKIAKREFKKGNTGIIIDSWNNDANGDMDDDSKKHWSISQDGKTFNKF